jgi:hypothetical protein
MNQNLNPLGLRAFAPYDASTHNFAQLRGSRRRAQAHPSSAQPPGRIPTGISVFNLLDPDCDEAVEDGDGGW